MRNFFKIFLVLFIFNNAYTQEKPAEIKKSTEKVISGGKVYYIHTVKQGQTVYSISKAYNVTLQDIASENPGILLEQIRPGQALKIPVITKSETLNESYFGLTKNDFNYHRVKQGQTAYFLSKKYNVPLDIIYKFNPGTESGVGVSTSQW